MCFPAVAAAAAPLISAGAGALGIGGAISGPTAFLSSLALTTAGAGLDYLGQSQAASAQDRVYRQNQRAARAAFNESSAQENIRLGQEQEAAAQKVQATRRELLQTTGRARVAAGEAGVSGLSVDALLADYGRQSAFYNESVRRNLAFTQQSTASNQRGLGSQFVSRVQSVQRGQRPSLAGLAIRVGGGALDAYSKFSAYDPETKQFRL